MLLLVDFINTLFIKEQGWNMDLLARLEKIEMKKIVVSNINNEKLNEMDIESGLPFPLFSMESKPRKTDAFFWLSLCEMHHCKLAELILIEHNPEVIKTASDLGIKTILYKHGDTEVGEIIDKVKNHL